MECVMGEHVVDNHVDVNHYLGNKLKAYTEFLAATMQLRDAFETEDMTKVEQLTQQREKMIRHINGLDHQMNQSNRNDGGGEKGDVISEALKKVLKKIIAANKDCEAVATLKCDLAKRELTTVHHKEKVISGYANKTRGIPKFLDVRT
jgi:hypothetical protein